MTRSHDSERQTGLVARLGLLEMPTQAKTAMTATARLWYKSAVAGVFLGAGLLKTSDTGTVPGFHAPPGPA
jgi:hypothetical protein